MLFTMIHLLTEFSNKGCNSVNEIMLKLMKFYHTCIILLSFQWLDIALFILYKYAFNKYLNPNVIRKKLCLNSPVM